jgi:hypothetical protein
MARNVTTEPVRDREPVDEPVKTPEERKSEIISRTVIEPIKIRDINSNRDRLLELARSFPPGANMVFEEVGDEMLIYEARPEDGLDDVDEFTP